MKISEIKIGERHRKAVAEMYPDNILPGDNGLLSDGKRFFATKHLFLHDGDPTLAAVAERDHWLFFSGTFGRYATSLQANRLPRTGLEKSFERRLADSIRLAGLTCEAQKRTRFGVIDIYVSTPTHTTAVSAARASCRHRWSRAMPTTTTLFDGQTFSPVHDASRLTAQAARVFGLMQDARWRTLGEIADATGDQPQSISARLRDFRKAKFGGHRVERRARGMRSDGLFEYRVVVKE